MDETLNDILVRDVLHPFHVAPRLVIAISNGEVAEPRYRVNLVERRHFVIEHTNFAREFLIFIGEGHFLPCLCRVVEVVLYHLQTSFLGYLVHPSIEIQQVGRILLDDFVTFVRPHLEPLVMIHQTAIKLGITRIIGCPIVLHRDIGIVDFMMKRSEELESALANCRSNLTQTVALRPHLGSAERSDLRVPHCKAIVMFGNDTAKACASLLEKQRPLVGIEMLGLEHRDKVVVAEFRKRSVDSLLSFALAHQELLALRILTARCIAVHVMKILFVTVSRNAIHPPMAIDAELGIA